MLGVDAYGSDDESDKELQEPQASSIAKSFTSKLPPPQKKSTFSLPPPTKASASGSKPSNGLSLPHPKSKRGPKKITIGLPSDDDDEKEEDEKPVAKKARLESGAGSSSLLAMLPAPKQKAPLAPAQQRVLGDGRGRGLVFNMSSRLASSTATEESFEDQATESTNTEAPTPEYSAELTESSSSVSFLPPSLVKGKPNISTEGPPKAPSRVAPVAKSAAPAVDFFSLGSSSSPPSTPKVQGHRPITSTPPALARPAVVPTGISAAPKVEDFVPPEPTPTDPHPGYYLLPTGQWAAYDTDYYTKFYNKWKADYDKYVRNLEKGKVKGFEELETEGAQEVDALAEMEKAKKDIQVKEERKALTHGAEGVAAAPKMNIKGAALGGRARTRHQLSTLLTEAYTNREALEERIAQGRRNRKEAGQKYGF